MVRHVPGEKLEPLWLEAAGSVTAVIVGGVGSKIGFNISRRHKRAKAKKAAGDAATSFVELDECLPELHNQVGTLVIRLGAQSRAKFESDLADVLKDCATAREAYTNYIAQPHTDTSVCDSRGNYRRMIDGYGTVLVGLQESLEAIAKLESTCTKFSAEIDDIAQTTAQTQACIYTARASIIQRRDEGWDVESLENKLRKAHGNFTDAETANAANEFIDCVALLKKAHSSAQAVIEELDELPVRRKKFQTKLAKHRHSLTTFLHDAAAAAVIIPTLEEAYASTCWAKIVAEFRAAELRPAQIQGLFEQLENAIDPAHYDWSAAEEFDKQLDDLLKAMLRAGQEILNAHVRLEKERADLRSGAQKLEAKVIKVVDSMRSRHGKQKDLIAELEQVGQRVGLLVKATVEPKPDLPQLAIDLSELQKLVTIFNDMSKAREDGRNEKVANLKFAASVALDAVGLGLLIDD